MAQRPPLSPRFAEAAAWVCELHRGQTRKGTDTPYVAHLYGVASLALEHGADEDEAIAALLHDGPEDQGGRETLEAIAQRFGARVAAIVDACTDTYEEPKPPWRERKERYLRHLPEASPSAQLVSLADKVYNLRAIGRDYRELGEELWSRFRSRSGPDVVWYYRSVLEVLGATAGDRRLQPLLVDLRDELAALERAIAAATA